MNPAFLQEYIACSAIYYPNDIKYRLQPANIDSGFVAYGHRHAHCRLPLMEIFYPNWVEERDSGMPMEEQPRIHVIRNEIQGFLTSKNRFVDRIEGMAIALAADQILPERENKLQSILYSEDIY
jgi:hypothetical protein